MKAASSAMRAGLAFLLMLWAHGAWAEEARVSLRWLAPDPAQPERAVLRCSGLPADVLARLDDPFWTEEDWQKLLPVHAEPPGLSIAVGLPAMSGSHAVDGADLVFTPRYPLQPGLRYRAAFQPEHLPGGKPAQLAPAAAVHQLPEPDRRPVTRILRISPELETLPENTLKFYLHFTGPMSGGGSYRHIRLRQKDGAEVPDPFLEIDQEMWNHGMTRLTLFIDPGRIKQGLRPRSDLGPVLQQGKSYTLEIDAAWQDAQGRPLALAFQKHFLVGPADHQCPQPTAWRIQPPASGSSQPLIVRFDEPLDEALAARLLRITCGSAQIAGQGSVLDSGRAWQFTPGKPWQAVEHQLEAPDILEDLAGNSLAKPFEVDLFTQVDPPARQQVRRLPFTPADKIGTAR
jgi:hypothetical protein